MFPTIFQPLSNYILFILIDTVYTLHHCTSLLHYCSCHWGSPCPTCGPCLSVGMNPTDPTKPPKSSLRAWLQHRTRTSWGNHFTHGPVLIFQLFLLHMQGLSDAQRLEDQRWCPNVPHLSQFLCNWPGEGTYPEWHCVLQSCCFPQTISNPLNSRRFRQGAKATVQPWEAPPRKTRCPWPCKRSTSLGCAETCLEKREIFNRNTHYL